MARSVVIPFSTKGLKQSLQAAKERYKVLIENAKLIKDTLQKRTELKRLRQEAKETRIQIQQAIRQRRFQDRGSGAAGRDFSFAEGELFKGKAGRLKEGFEFGRSLAGGSFESLATGAERLATFLGPQALAAAAALAISGPVLEKLRELSEKSVQRSIQLQLGPRLVEIEQRLANLDLERQLADDAGLRNQRARAFAGEQAAIDRARVRAGLWVDEGGTDLIEGF